MVSTQRCIVLECKKYTMLYDFNINTDRVIVFRMSDLVTEDNKKNKTCCLLGDWFFSSKRQNFLYKRYRECNNLSGPTHWVTEPMKNAGIKYLRSYECIKMLNIKRWWYFCEYIRCKFAAAEISTQSKHIASHLLVSDSARWCNKS